jgi:DNA-binding transcriptional MerR regulator
VLARVPRAVNGHRLYGEQDIARIQFIARLRATGMTLATI